MLAIGVAVTAFSTVQSVTTTNKPSQSQWFCRDNNPNKKVRKRHRKLKLMY